MTYMTADAPIFCWPNIEFSDQFARQLGWYAKGNSTSLITVSASTHPFNADDRAWHPRLESRTSGEYRGSIRWPSPATSIGSFGTRRAICCPTRRVLGWERRASSTSGPGSTCIPMPAASWTRTGNCKNKISWRSASTLLRQAGWGLQRRDLVRRLPYIFPGDPPIPQHREYELAPCSHHRPQNPASSTFDAKPG